MLIFGLCELTRQRMQLAYGCLRKLICHIVAVKDDRIGRQALTAQSLHCHPAVSLGLWLCPFHITGSGDSLGYWLCHSSKTRSYCSRLFRSFCACHRRLIFHFAVTDNQIHSRSLCHTGTDCTIFITDLKDTAATIHLLCHLVVFHRAVCKQNK